MNKIKIMGVHIEYDSMNVRIRNSYEIKDEEYMKRVLKKFKERTGYHSRRSIKSWLKEWKSHNRLYRLGLFRTHTADCDLEEHEKLHRLIAYEILGI